MENTTIRRRIRRKIIAAMLSVGGLVAFASTAASAGTTWHGTTWH